MKPRLGLIARADNRGLGLQTLDFYQHMKPEKVLVVAMGQHSPYRNHLDRFPGALVVGFDELSDRAIHQFLDGVDVVYTAETPYNFRLFTLAAERGIATVMQANFEFLRALREPDLPRPDVFLAPSSWRYEEWPTPKMLLPFPVDRERFPFQLRTEAKTFLHIGGHPTRADRNGTELFLAALRQVHTPMGAIVTTQQRIPTSLTDQRALGGFVTLELREGDEDDNRRLYDGGDVLVLPRRFGGLSLQMNEAASLGMPILTLDVAPQNEWVPREGLVHAHQAGGFDGQSTWIDMYHCAPETLAAGMSRLALEPETVEAMSRASDAYAESISWERLGPKYQELFESLT